MSAEVSVLFDAPGPKARLRYNIIAVVGGLAIAALLVLLVRALAAKDQFTAAKWAPFLDPATWTAYLLPGLRATLVAAFFSIILAVVFGILLGMGRLSQLAAGPLGLRRLRRVLPRRPGADDDAVRLLRVPLRIPDLR